MITKFIAACVQMTAKPDVLADVATKLALMHEAADKGQMSSRSLSSARGSTPRLANWPLSDCRKTIIRQSAPLVISQRRAR